MKKPDLHRIDTGIYKFLKILSIGAAALSVISLAAVTVYVLVSGVGKLTPEPFVWRLQRRSFDISGICRNP